MSGTHDSDCVCARRMSDILTDISSTIGLQEGDSYTGSLSTAVSDGDWIDIGHILPPLQAPVGFGLRLPFCHTVLYSHGQSGDETLTSVFHLQAAPDGGVNGVLTAITPFTAIKAPARFAISSDGILDDDELNDFVLETPGGTEHSLAASVRGLLWLFNARNVAVRDCGPSTSSRSARRAAERNGRSACTIRHHTLSVTLPSFHVTHSRREGVGEMPRHKVRGHFADYRARPLFGKHHGVFFVPDHWRGSEAYGIITKDYCIAPAPEGRKPSPDFEIIP